MTLSLPDLLAVVEAAAKWAILQELAKDHGCHCLKCETSSYEFQERVREMVEAVKKNLDSQAQEG